VVCGLPAALGIREGGACVGFFARVYPRPLCDWPGRPSAPGQLCARGPVGRAAGHGGFDARGSRVRGSADFGRLRQSLPAPVGRVGHSGRWRRVRASGRKKAEPNPDPEPRD
jgi:hypothetical protein